MSLRHAVGAATACAALAAPAAAVAHTPIKSTSPKTRATVDRGLRAVEVMFRGSIPDGQLTVRTASGTKVSRGEGRLVRGDREGATPEVRDVLASYRWMDFVCGLAGNAVLLRQAAPTLQEARRRQQQRVALARAHGQTPPTRSRRYDACV